MRKVLVTLAIAAALAGCGGNHLGGSGGVGEPLALFGSDFETAFCTPRVACLAFNDLATCVAFNDFARGEIFRDLAASVGRGTVSYDPVAAAACIAALPQDCSVTYGESQGVPGDGGAWWAMDTIDACTRVFTGTLPLGAACREWNKECAPSMYCDTSAGTPCMGTCTAIGAPETRHAVGEDCSDSGWCALPGICQGTCVVPPDHLASCDPSTQFSCGHLDDYCAVAAGASTPTCLPRIAPGAACTILNVNGADFDPCVEAATCAGGVCVLAPVLGAACDSRCIGGALGCTNGICTVSPYADLCPI